jgi:3-keto-disaccharide hydrolase
MTSRLSTVFALVLVSLSIHCPATAAVGVGAAPIPGAEVILDGSRKMLDDKWTYWKGPRFASSLPIKWQVVDDPVDGGHAISSYDPAAAGGKYGAADIVTKKPYRDFRLHVEFLVMKPGGNSGVFLQNRYEIQIFDGNRTTHGMAAVINEKSAPYTLYNGVRKWNAYDITFRAARFLHKKLVELPMITMYFNGKKVHDRVRIHQVWGGPNSGIDGGNDNGRGITDSPQGLKLQSEGHDIRFRNVWIKELNLDDKDTDFTK